MGSLQSLNMDSKIRQSFVPDYSVRAISDVVYIAIKRVLYLTAKKATLLEKSRKSGTFSNETFDDEVERLLHSITEDEKTPFLVPNQYTKRISLTTPSGNSSPSNVDLSHDERNNSVSKHIHDERKKNNPEQTDNASISSSLVASEVEDHQCEGHDNRYKTTASIPLLPKLSDISENKQSKPQ